MGTIIKNKWANLVLLYAAVLPFGPALPNIILGLIVGVVLMYFLRGKLKIGRQQWRIFLICNSFYFIIVLSLLWSTDQARGLEKILLLTLIPLMFLALICIRNFLTIQVLIKAIQTFAIATSTLFILSLFLAIYHHGFSLQYITEQNLASALVSIHYLSFSLYCSIALVLSLFSFLRFKGMFWPFFGKITVFILIVLWSAILLSTSRTAIFFTAIIVVFLVMGIRNDLTLKIKVLVVCIFVSINAFLLFLNNPLREKLKEAVNFNKEYNVQNYWGGRGFRELIWNCSLHVVNENRIIGVGFGDQQEELNTCFKKYRYNQLLVKGNIFNAHNIYLQMLLSTGILGLLVFLVSLTFPVYLGLKSPPFQLLFVLTIMLLGFTESYFNRNAFISLFAFFNSLILFTFYKDENSSNS